MKLVVALSILSFSLLAGNSIPDLAQNRNDKVAGCLAALKADTIPVGADSETIHKKLSEAIQSRDELVSTYVHVPKFQDMAKALTADGAKPTMQDFADVYGYSVEPSLDAANTNMVNLGLILARFCSGIFPDLDKRIEAIIERNTDIINVKPLVERVVSKDVTDNMVSELFHKTKDGKATFPTDMPSANSQIVGYMTQKVAQTRNEFVEKEQKRRLERDLATREHSVVVKRTVRSH